MPADSHAVKTLVADRSLASETAMKLYFVEPGFFSGSLNGARIPVFLRMLQDLEAGHAVHAQYGSECAELRSGGGQTIDDAFARLQRQAVPRLGETVYREAVCQKGQGPVRKGQSDLRGVPLVLMLNDSYARQAMNQFKELISGRFGVDRYRLLAPLRILLGLWRDLRSLRAYDQVLVQTDGEARFLDRIRFGVRAAGVTQFNNKSVQLALFPKSLVPRPDTRRKRRFLLTIPAAPHRFGEYRWFLNRLARHPGLARQVTVQGAESAKALLHAETPFVGRVDDFQAFLEEFDCVVIPTKHFTGMNNRVLQAAMAGCDVICSPEAVVGLNDGPDVIARTCNSFAEFIVALETYPHGEAFLKPDVVLA